MTDKNTEQKLSEIKAYAEEMSTITPHTQYEEGLKSTAIRILHIINT